MGLELYTGNLQAIANQQLEWSSAVPRNHRRPSLETFPTRATKQVLPFFLHLLAKGGSGKKSDGVSYTVHSNENIRDVVRWIYQTLVSSLHLSGYTRFYLESEVFAERFLEVALQYDNKIAETIVQVFAVCGVHLGTARVGELSR